MSEGTEVMVASIFDETVKVAPERDAIRGTSSASTYAALQRTSNSIAWELSRIGDIEVPNLLLSFTASTLGIAAIIGAVKAGFTPYLIEPTCTQTSLVKYLELSHSKVLLKEGGAPGYANTKYQLQMNKYSDVTSLSCKHSVVDISVGAHVFGPRDPVSDGTRKDGRLSHGVGLFTSGTMGERKLVFRTWESFMFLRDVSASERLVIVALPIHHVAGLGNILQTLFSGQTVGIGNGLNPHSIRRLLRRSIDTEIIMTPTQASSLSRSVSDNDTRYETVSDVQLTGARANRGLCEHMRRLFPKATIFCGYGVTEVNVRMGYIPPGETLPLGSIGKPYPDATLFLADSDGKAANVGELWVQKDGAESMDATKRWYKTGDILRVDSDGWYYYIDRKDNMMVIAGENVYPAEVEALLVGHPDIVEACVVPIPLDSDGDPKLGAVCVTRANCGLSREGVYAYLSEVSTFTTFPQLVEFVDKMPILSSGKIDRVAVQTLLLDARAGGHSGTLDLNEVEVRLTNVWQDVLGVSSAGGEDDFFELGGDSLKLVKLLVRVYQEFGVSWEISEVASHSSFIDMLAYLRAR